MKKIWISVFLILFSVLAFGQVLPLINIGTGPNMHNGDVARTWATKDNACITQVNLLTPIVALKQDLLVAGTNIKTINGVSPLGGGNMVIGSGGTMVYPAGGIVVSTGAAWATSVTNNSANWNTAYGWGNHSLAGYISGTRTVNGHPLSSNVTVTAADLNLGYVTNESKATMFNNVTLTGTLTLGSTLLNSSATDLNVLYNTSVTPTELSYLDATSPIQAQINGKEASLGNPLVSGYVLSSTSHGARSWVAQGSGGGSGTVTSVGVTTANGVSGSVTNPTTIPAITLILGAITPTSVNGLTNTALTTGFTIAGGTTSKTLTVPLDASVSGTNTGDNATNSQYSSLVTNATHTGDVTGSGALTIANSAVTLAKMANMATASLIYRKTAGTGAPEVNSLATLKTDLGLTNTNSGDQTTITGNAGSATILAVSRTINTVGFNGSTNITVPSDIAPGAAGNVMLSTGSAWSSDTPVDYTTLVSLKHPVMNAQTGSSYTLQLTDDNTLVTMTYGSACALTVPLNSSVGFPYSSTTYSVVNIANLGAGTLTVAPYSGVTFIPSGSFTLSTGGGASLSKIGINTWWVAGKLNQ